MTTTNQSADKIASKHNLTKARSEAIVEAVFESIIAVGWEIIQHLVD